MKTKRFNFSAAFCLFFSLAAQSGYTASGIEAPATIYFDGVSSNSITASGYATPPAFTGLGTGLSGVTVAMNNVYKSWRNGNIWTTKAAIP